MDLPFQKSSDDFVVDTDNFPHLDQLTDTLHSNYMKIVPIIDGFVSCDNKFGAFYQKATTKGVTIKTTINKDNKYSDNLISKVNDNKVAFIDWFSRNT